MSEPASSRASDAYDEARDQSRQKGGAVVRLTTPYGDTAARLRNISPLGLMAEADMALIAGMRVSATLSGVTATGTIRWVRGRAFGLKFDRAMSFDALRAVGERPRHTESPRAPRVMTNRAAIVTYGAGARNATVRNVSMSGLMLQTPLPLLPGQTVRVTAEGWPSLAGQVRWSRDGTAGVLFVQPLTQAQFDALPK